MQEIFDKTPIEEFEKMIEELRRARQDEDADKLAYLIASIRYRAGYKQATR